MRWICNECRKKEELFLKDLRCILCKSKIIYRNKHNIFRCEKGHEIMSYDIIKSDKK